MTVLFLSSTQIFDDVDFLCCELADRLARLGLRRDAVGRIPPVQRVGPGVRHGDAAARREEERRAIDRPGTQLIRQFAAIESHAERGGDSVVRVAAEMIE